MSEVVGFTRQEYEYIAHLLHATYVLRNGISEQDDNLLADFIEALGDGATIEVDEDSDRPETDDFFAHLRVRKGR
jgi:hypothetical protein